MAYNRVSRHPDAPVLGRILHPVWRCGGRPSCLLGCAGTHWARGEMAHGFSFDLNDDVINNVPLQVLAGGRLVVSGVRAVISGVSLLTTFCCT